MGANIVRRLGASGITSVVHDVNADAVAALAAEGFTPASDLAALAAALPTPRTVWVMVPAAVTDLTIEAVAAHLSAGDTIIDGGNSYYKNDVTNAAKLAEKGINFVDVGTSGGVYGLERGHWIHCLKRSHQESLPPIAHQVAPESHRQANMDTYIAGL
jgi:6-phosphogluconate dehydrogenase